MENFINSGDARETSSEIMEAISFLSNGDIAIAERIWADPTDAEMLAIYERATKNGLLSTDNWYWGAASNRGMR